MNNEKLGLAYNKRKFYDVLYEKPYCDQIEKSTINNLWDFLGISSLSKKKQSCLFECSIHGSKCLESSSNNSKCLNHGLKCMKKCIDPPIIQTKNITIPIGNKYDPIYAPSDSSLWPSYTQVGWDIDKIDKIDTNDYIEILF